MEFKYQKNLKYLILAFGGVMLMCMAYLIHAFNPLDLIVDWVMTLTEGSFLFSVWRKPPYDILLKTYVFNVTNHEAFLSGSEKLRFEEIGPYVYQEVLTNGNSQFNENGTLTFHPVRHLVYRPELSVGDIMEDKVISPNIPLLAITSVISEYGLFLNLGLSSLINIHNEKEFVDLNVYDYMWGYSDPLVTLANTFIPGWIDFPKFGIFDRLMAVDNASNVVTVNLNERTEIPTDGSSETETTRLPYSISRFNGSPGLKHWGYHDQVSNETIAGNSKCNTIEGAFDAGLFPKHLKENTTLYLYRRAFCRPVEMNYENTSYNDDGIKVHNYRVNPNFLANPVENDNNNCYCYKKECLPSGFGSLAPCYYSMPIIISQPHYFNADPETSAQVEGLHPDQEKHDTVLQINPDLGIPVMANLRIQINLKVSKKQYNAKAKTFSDMMVPLFWLELQIKDVPSNLKLLIVSTLNVFPIMQQVFMWLMGLMGLSMIAASALVVFYFPPEHRLEDPFGNRIGYSPILVLPIPQHFKPDLRISK